MTTETVYTNAFSNTTVAWTEVGATPYLNDSDANYVWTNANALVESYWTFPATAGTGTINSVKFRLEVANGESSVEIKVEVWNGAAWVDLGNVTMGPDYAWKDVDASATLTTWAKVNDARIRVTSVLTLPDVANLRRLTRKVDFTVVNIYTVEPQYFNTVARRFSEAFRNNPTFEVTLNSLVLGSADSGLA